MLQFRNNQSLLNGGNYKFRKRFRLDSIKAAAAATL